MDHSYLDFKRSSLPSRERRNWFVPMAMFQNTRREKEVNHNMPSEQTPRGFALSTKILLMNIFLVCFTLVFSLGVSLNYSIGLLEKNISENLCNFSETLSTTKVVIEALENRCNTPELNAFLNAIVKSDNNIDIITVADMTGLRYYHVDEERVGEYIVGGDEARAIDGESYMSDAVGTRGLQRRSFHPVYGADGRQIGFILTSVLMQNLETMRDKVMQVYFRSAIIVFAVGLIACALLTISIKRSLLGYEPSQITHIFLQRGEIMDSLEEGLLAVDKHGEVILVNRAAEEMLLVKSDDLLGHSVQQATLPPGLKQLFTDNQSDGKNLLLGKENILYDRIPILHRGKEMGVVAILRNRTEATRLAEQLTGVNHFIEALRANTHEFMNKLHVILGLLQINEPEEAKRYIVDISQEQNDTISAVTHCIQNRTLAALILGKFTHGKELGIQARLSPNSVAPRHGRYLSTNAELTIVGNLLENAIEAVNQKEGGSDKEIILLVHEDDKCLMISVDDTGVGMTAEEIATLEAGHYTTKGEHRGCGMGLIRSIVNSSEGALYIDSEKDTGSTFTVIIEKPR